MNLRKDTLIGQKFSELTVISRLDNNKRGERVWLCKCVCGNITFLTSYRLNSGYTKSCGCKQYLKPKLSKAELTRRYGRYINTKINKLFILGFGGINKYNQYRFTCQCDCGNVKNVLITSIINGKTKSCGCYRIEIVTALKGEKHHAWNKNKTKEQRKKELIHRTGYDTQYKKWAQKIKQLANYICLICNVKGGRLESHHLNNWKYFESQRYKLNNGACLCKQCHSQFHKIHGNKVTKKMFKLYLLKINRTRSQ